MRILGLSGSLRAGSHNTQLLRLAAEELPEGVELELYEDLASIPPFDQDLVELAPDEVERLKDAVAASDAILVATPEFNGSIPGQLKNAVDWVSRPLRRQPGAREAGRRDRREHELVRRDLGPARAEEGASGSSARRCSTSSCPSPRPTGGSTTRISIIRAELAGVVDALVAAVEGEGSTSGSAAAAAVAA